MEIKNASQEVRNDKSKLRTHLCRRSAHAFSVQTDLFPWFLLLQCQTGYARRFNLIVAATNFPNRRTIVATQPTTFNLELHMNAVRSMWQRKTTFIGRATISRAIYRNTFGYLYVTIK